MSPEGSLDTSGRGWSAAAVPPAFAAALVGDEAAAALEAGQAIWLGDGRPEELQVRPVDWVDDELVVGDTRTLEIVTRRFSDPAIAADGAYQLPRLLIPEATVAVDGANAEPRPDQWEGAWFVVLGNEPVNATSLAAAGAIAEERSDGQVTVRVERGYESGYGIASWAVTIVGAVAGLALVAVAIALAAAEARPDLVTLRSVGAGRRTRRSLAAGRALLLAGIGGVLAVPAGLVPAWAVLSSLDLSVPLQVPWTTIAIVAAGVPLLATAGATLLGARDRLARTA